MRKLFYPTFLLFTLYISTTALWAQRFDMDASLDLDTWFDNREYKSELTPDMTLFGMMLTPQVAFKWNYDNAIWVGTNVAVDFGDRKYKRKPELIAYYRYEGDNGFYATVGVFPRKKVFGDYPTLFFSDSVSYYDSNLDGLLLQYFGRRGHVELACDWLNMISDDQREKFVVFSSGNITTQNEKFFAGYYASMFHHSISYNDSGVVDNLLAYPYIGFRMFKKEDEGYSYSDLLSIKAGWVQAMQRDRINENKYVTPGGVQIEVNAEKWRLGIHNTLYLGDNLMPYYSRYGNGLYQGDALYRTSGDVYNRLEIYWNPLRKLDKYLRISSIHHYDGKRWGWQQLIRFSVSINKDSVRGW